jgi:hypothetical protein
MCKAQTLRFQGHREDVTFLGSRLCGPLSPAVRNGARRRNCRDCYQVPAGMGHDLRQLVGRVLEQFFPLLTVNSVPLQVEPMQHLTRFALFLFSFTASATPALSAAPPDAFTLWERGAFRGANVMQAQCTDQDLPVLRSWGANLAEIPVSNVYAPAPPYAFQPQNLAKLDRAVEAAERARLYVALTCREGPGRPDFNRSHEIW